MINRLTTLLTLLALLSGCVTETVKTTAVPTLSTYETSLPSDEVLDIAVVVFDPGIADVDPEEGIYPEIRRARRRLWRANSLSCWMIKAFGG